MECEYSNNLATSQLLINTKIYIGLFTHLMTTENLTEYNIFTGLYGIVVQLLSHVLLFVTPWTAALQASLSFNISQSLLNFMSIDLVMMPSNHLNKSIFKEQS